MKRLVREHGKLRKQAKGLISEALGRGQGHGADLAGPPEQAPAQGDRVPGGDAGRPAALLRGPGAPLGRPRVPRQQLRPAARAEVKDGPRVPRQAFLPIWRLLFWLVYLLFLTPLLGGVSPVAGYVKLQDDGVIHHPVAGCGGGHGVGEDALPLGEDQV